VKNRQISHAEELQITYIDAPPLRRWMITPHSLSVHSTPKLPSKEYRMTKIYQDDHEAGNQV
jgi:hypothetical protein